MRHWAHSSSVSLFCVAAPADRAFLMHWETHLLPLKQAGLMTFWSELHLQAGVHRLEQLLIHLDQADCIVLLMSADFFASDECLTLMRRALLNRQKNATVVIPLLLRSVAWQESTLAALPYLPTKGIPVTQWSHQDEAFHICLQELCALLKLPLKPSYILTQRKARTTDHSFSFPTFHQHFFSTFLFLLTILGIPTAIIALFPQFVLKHPLLVLAIGLLYEISLFLLSFLGKIWLGLESYWLATITEWTNYWIQDLFSRHRKHYCQYLCYRHRDLDVKGVSTLGSYTLELDQVFVELRIDPTTPHQAATNPIQVPQAPLKKKNSIWDYLDSAPLRNQHLIIVGPPGCGKTTLLKYIALLLASPEKKYHHTHSIIAPHNLPILLFIRDYAKMIKEIPNFSLVDAFLDHLKNWEQPLPTEGWVKYQLTKGRCLIMLDGLDEVADPDTRQTVVNWVKQQIETHRQNRFLVTSRPFGYRSNPLDSGTILEILPFTTQQVEHFVHKWYLANEIMNKQKDDTGVQMIAKSQARALLQQLRNMPHLFALTANPLLLTIIATVHRYRRELPSNRVALYAEICEAFLGKRQKDRGQPLEFTPAQIRLVLETLAYHFMVKGIRNISLDEARTVIEPPLSLIRSKMPLEAFLQLVENTSGLLLEQENAVYSFAHLTIQEYLAAAYIREKQLGNTLITQVGTTWWQETIRLYCAMTDATPILTACLTDDHPSTALVELAIDCSKEAREIQPEMRDKIEILLKQGVEDSNTEQQHLVSGALLSRRLRKMIHLQDEVYTDTSFITCAEYQIFLDGQRARGQYFQPDHWTSYRFQPGQGNTPILGMRISDAEAFCMWLSEREPSPWTYRLPKIGEIEDEVMDKLSSGIGYWLKGNERFAWAKEVLVLPVTLRQELARDSYAEAEILISAFTRVIGSGYKGDFTRTIYAALDQVHTKALTHIHPLDLDHASDFNLSHILDPALIRALKLISTQLFGLTDIHAYALNRTRALDLTRTLDLASARTSALASALALIYSRQMLLSRRRSWQYLDRSQKQKEDQLLSLLEHLLLVYMDLIILEKRISGDCSACEGLLIVKEGR